MPIPESEGRVDAGRPADARFANAGAGRVVDPNGAGRSHRSSYYPKCVCDDAGRGSHAVPEHSRRHVRRGALRCLRRPCGADPCLLRQLRNALDSCRRRHYGRLRRKAACDFGVRLAVQGLLYGTWHLQVRRERLRGEVCRSLSVEGEPHLPPESRLARNLASLEREVGALLLKRATCRRVTVIALPSGHLGRWKTDRESLVTAFPNADLRVYLPENLAWQAEGGGKGQLKLEIVKGRGWRGWIGPIRRALFSLPNPTVVLCSGAYTSGRLPKIKKLINLLITSLLPFRHVLFARTLCDFCGVLSEQIERRE